ncbi:MAG: adenosylcobinamide-GDP ribazoletransferase [Firmicutes bacterium]|nr:adenosylcobinamide-GDP ribazoletransferase [Bacillota bacterium]
MGVFSIVALIVLVAAMAAGRYAIKQLGGMNGDIAGYMVVMSETIGVLTAAVLASVV